MPALPSSGDVAAVPVLRRIGRWYEGRVGMEAIAALYDLGDDTLLPRLIDLLKPNADFPEIDDPSNSVFTLESNAENCVVSWVIAAWRCSIVCC